MLTEQQTRKWEKWNRFVSLAWYDGAIEFLFRFVAKTSEPLLALGLVISAVDFLTKGALLSNNQPLTMAWAWTQAVAIEASSGVVFVYALQSFKGKDKVKGWLYLVLSVLLAITGGAMLLLQLVANLTTLGESALPASVVIGLAVLRVVVSIGYVYMCRAKHIRFTDLEEVEQTSSIGKANGTSPSISDETVQLILSKLAKLDQLEQVIAEQKITIIQEVEQPLALLAPGGTEHGTDGTESDEASLQAHIAEILTETPDIKVRELAAIVGHPQTTVYRHMVQVKKQMEQVEQKESEI